MTEDVKPPVDHRTPRPSGAHAGHDELLIARFAADDVTGTETAMARRLTRDCDRCATLFAEIAAISAAVRTDLPTPIRPRDFRLSPEQARSLRGRPSFAAWLRGLLSPGGSVLQPLAGAAMSIGIALIVVGTVLPAPTLSSDESRNGSVTTPSSAPAAGAESEPSAAAAALPPSPGDRSAAEASAGAPAYASPQAPLPSAAASAGAATTDTGGQESPPSTTSPMAVSGSPQESGGSVSTKSSSPSPEASSAFGSYDQATPSPLAVAAVPGGSASPAPTAARLETPADQPTPSDDRRPLLITLGVLLGLSGAVLFGLRRVARRA